MPQKVVEVFFLVEQAAWGMCIPLRLSEPRTGRLRMRRNTCEAVKRYIFWIWGLLARESDLWDAQGDLFVGQVNI
jgi:hypothetical protein